MNFPDWFAARHPQIPIASANAVLKLAEGGATVPFIARYRKEQTGNLDEVAIRAVIDAKERWDELIKRQAFIVEEIDAAGEADARAGGEACAGRSISCALEDIYLPYKQKRKTKAQTAREAGLEPLAEWLWDCGHGALSAGRARRPRRAPPRSSTRRRASPTRRPRWPARATS